MSSVSAINMTGTNLKTIVYVFKMSNLDGPMNRCFVTRKRGYGRLLEIIIQLL